MLSTIMNIPRRLSFVQFHEKVVRKVVTGPHSVVVIGDVDGYAVLLPGDVGLWLSSGRATVHDGHFTQRNLHISGLDAEVLPQR